ncbi:peptidoglycan-binding protein [Clostridia bacterium OttesenSCG-928-F22]|nr:peptidoglycan-binding protein [Clostridia bacterium OttesenSCG-928-F22]
MGSGVLVVRVYADNIAQPVAGAIVEVLNEENGASVQTDLEGMTAQITLSAPDVQYSLQAQNEVVPYAEYRIRVSKSGLVPKVINGVQIFADQIAYQDVFLESVDETTQQEQQLDIPNVPVGGNPPKIPENPVKPEARVLPFVVIPEYIIVHDGLPTNSNAANYSVPFPDYVKNVASSEIYSTWPRETIKANVYAIASFTLNRVFTEWYVSQGYNFTITASTQYDQKYIHGRTIFESISSVVDEVFRTYIKRQGMVQPFLAQYSDGINVNRPNWLSQWGSKDLGDKGYQALQILQYYYGNSVYLAQADQVQGLPSSFPGYNLSLGACGEEVQKLQNELNVIRGSYPGIPVVTNPDGNFTEQTKSAVETFQSVFKLPVTGVVDYATWYKISYIFVAVSKMLQGIT